MTPEIADAITNGHYAAFEYSWSDRSNKFMLEEAWLALVKAVTEDPRKAVAVKIWIETAENEDRASA